MYAHELCATFDDYKARRRCLDTNSPSRSPRTPWGRYGRVERRSTTADTRTTPTRTQKIASRVDGWVVSSPTGSPWRHRNPQCIQIRSSSTAFRCHGWNCRSNSHLCNSVDRMLDQMSFNPSRRRERQIYFSRGESYPHDIIRCLSDLLTAAFAGVNAC
jgi:hypothetical protein